MSPEEEAKHLAADHPDWITAAFDGGKINGEGVNLITLQKTVELQSGQREAIKIKLPLDEAKRLSITLSGLIRFIEGKK